MLRFFSSVYETTKPTPFPQINTHTNNLAILPGLNDSMLYSTSEPFLCSRSVVPGHRLGKKCTADNEATLRYDSRPVHRD
jgi:hypothetical protein